MTCCSWIMYFFACIWLVTMATVVISAFLQGSKDDDWPD